VCTLLSSGLLDDFRLTSVSPGISVFVCLVGRWTLVFVKEMQWEDLVS
jgi:hypothetical protein